MKINVIDSLNWMKRQWAVNDIAYRNLPRFQEIKEMYSIVIPEWMDDFNKTGRMIHDPYFRDFYKEMSPIEKNVWSDIRCKGLPFYPEIPVCGYFIDFGCPFLKIGIECDGAEFHDKEKDQKRDNVLINAGWTIYRLTGRECNKFMIDDICDGIIERTEENMCDYYLTTAEGVLEAIRLKYFPIESDFDSKYKSIAEHTLDIHRSVRSK